MKFAIALVSTMVFASSAWSETVTINIKSFKFSSAEVVISAGDTIIWTNQDGAAHTATAVDGSFNTGTLKKGESGEVTFATAGTFDYFCKFHRNMKARIVVN